MATIGQSLAAPEAGWRRYDDTAGNIKYVDTWEVYADSNQYGGSMKWTTVVGASAELKFKGTKLRIIGRHYADRSATNTVIIDGVSYTFSQRSATVEKALSFEITGLSNSEHTVKIVAGDTGTGSGKLSIDAIDIDDTGYIPVAVGQQLTAPEPGWRRYDSEDGRIMYSGGTWNLVSSASYYNGSSRQLQSASAKVQFKFYGTKFRMSAILAPNSVLNATNVKVDGAQVGVMNQYGATTVFQALNYEVVGLSLGVHTVELENNTYAGLVIDSIDIDDMGKLVHPYLPEKTSLADMEIGDVISCEYVVTTSTTAGIFSNLGTTTKALLPAAPGLVPNGSFYFVKVDSGLLIADRVLQRSISWSTLNSANLVEGIVGSASIGANTKLRLPSGGVAAIDASGNPTTSDTGLGGFPSKSEWDDYVVKSNLGGKITPADDNIWHWSNSGSLVRGTSYANTVNCVFRGVTTGGKGVNTSLDKGSYGPSAGLRPVLEFVDSTLPARKAPTTIWY